MKANYASSVPLLLLPFEDPQLNPDWMEVLRKQETRSFSKKERAKVENKMDEQHLRFFII